MANLLTVRTQLAIKAALQNVVDTFFKCTVTLNSKVTVTDRYGERPVSTITTRDFDVLADFSVGKSGRYQDVEKSELGQRDESSFHLYFWADDVKNSGVTVDAEADTVTLRNIPSIPDGEYEIRLFAPSALFSDLGFLLYDMELKIYGG